MKQLILLCNILFLFAFTNVKAQVESQVSNKEQPNFAFAFLTDIHLKPELVAVDGFKKAIDTTNKLKPDFVITGGDLVLDATDQTFGRADSLYNLYINTSKLFKMPVYNIIGNHELYGTFSKNLPTTVPFYGKKMFENKIGKRYQTFMYKGWKFMLLDDIDGTEKEKYKGLIDSVEMQWIRDELSKTDTRTPLIIALHIPIITAFTQFEKGALAPNPEGLVANNSKELLDLFKNYNLKLVLQGHLHVYENMYVRNIYFITGGAISGWKWKGPNFGTKEGFVMVNVKNGNLSFNYIEYGSKTQN